MMFLQMVWDDTTRIGCGVANNEQEKEIYVVVRYSPTFTDKSPKSMASHVKPPTQFLFNETCELYQLYFPPYNAVPKRVGTNNVTDQ